MMDGLTTNGVLLMNPKGGPSCQPTIWREISVCGNVYGLRKTRSTTERGKTVSVFVSFFSEFTFVHSVFYSADNNVIRNL